MQLPPTPYCNKNQLKRFYKTVHFTYSALASSTKQILILPLENVQGKVSSEQIVKLSFNMRFVTSFLQYSLSFYFPSCHEIVHFALHTDEKFTQRCKNIYLCTHRGFAFLNEECSRVK